MKTIQMKRFTFIAFLTALLLFICLPWGSNKYASAEDKLTAKNEAVKTEIAEELKTSVEVTAQSLFKNKKLSVCDYLYNLDGSPDYIYTEFEGGGYAI